MKHCTPVVSDLVLIYSLWVQFAQGWTGDPRRWLLIATIALAVLAISIHVLSIMAVLTQCRAYTTWLFVIEDANFRWSVITRSLLLSLKLVILVLPINQLVSDCRDEAACDNNNVVFYS